MQDFKLEVGRTYVDGDGERHTCTEYDAGVGCFLCTGEETGEGVYFPTGEIYVGPNAESSRAAYPAMVLRPI